MKLINNQETRLFDELKSALQPGSEVFISTSYISVNALFELSTELNQVDSIHILLDGLLPDDTRFGYDALEFKQYHDLRAKYKAGIALEILNSKCSIRQGNVGGQKFVLVRNAGRTQCFSIVPQDLNSVSLGILQSTSPIIISSFEDTGNQYENLFNQFWNNSNKDIKSQIVNIVEKACTHHSADEIYKFSLYNIFQNATIDEASDQRLKKIGFKNTLIWGMLYNFQQDAVLGAIDKIESFGGCIIADSVGLGKTFEALAVMKYYQMRNDRILVLCPKKLRDNC